MSPAQAAARAGSASARIGFLGPAGTFSEQALLSQKDLAAMELVDFSTIPDVLAATESGEVDLGFVPIENSIEGTVNAALDVLALESDLLIQREVVINVQLNLLALPGVGVDELTAVAGFPVAMAQVRTWLREHLAEAEVVAANSNADAARLVQVRAGVGRRRGRPHPGRVDPREGPGGDRCRTIPDHFDQRPGRARCDWRQGPRRGRRFRDAWHRNLQQRRQTTVHRRR